MEKEILKRYPGSTVLSIPSSPTFFAKIKDVRIPEKRACDVLLEDFDITVNNGTPMGETNEYIRMNISGYSSLLVDLLNRLAGEDKYKVNDVFVASKNVCAHTQVCAVSSYTVKPGDCSIDVDASKGAAEILLPLFIDYEMGQKIKIKKIDSSKNAVTIKAKEFTRTLKKSDDTLEVQWKQPLYVNPHWEILKEK
jgi:hypothetical protein